MPNQPNTDLLAIERSLWTQYPCIAGIDEAGRGAWAGPVVAAAAIFAPDVLIPGVDDSKKLTSEKREALFDVIINGCIAYGIGSVEAPVIDQINIWEATKQAMIKAVAGLGTQPQLLLIDGNGKIEHPLPQKTVIDGDALSHSIAAASILAKVYRDRLMRKLAEEFPAYGFEKHKGYGTKDHQVALRTYGVLPIHRKSYAPIRVMLPTNIP